MKVCKLKSLLFLVVAASMTACAPENHPEDDKEDVKEEVGQKPEPDPDDGGQEVPGPSYDNLSAYDVLKNYVNRQKSPDFRLGTAVTAQEFIRKGQHYGLAVDNFDEMTTGNAMKQASVMKRDGSMDFTLVKNFLDLADQAGMTVYGHTLAWHAQQADDYLNGLLRGKKVEHPSSGSKILLEADFDDGKNPFMGWGNESVREIVDGCLKVSNPSSVHNWQAQFAYDVPEPFVKDQSYRLSFKIRGSSEGSISAGFQITDGYHSAGEFPDVHFGTEWKSVESECICSADGGTRLIFSFGAFSGDIYIDDFVFTSTGISYTYEPLTAAEKKEVLTEAMDRWIKGVMEVTAKRVSAWDAVNEPVSGEDKDGDGYYELESAEWGSTDNFYWQDYLGPEDYIRIVVEKARKYYAEYGGTAPLRLFINDYNLESDWDDNRKLKSLIHWIEVWESDGVTKIDGIGTQMHVSYYENPDIQASKERHYVKMLELMASTGKLVKISELDMGYVDIDGNTVPTSRMQDHQHRAMADYYEFIVRKYFEIVPFPQQYGITQWCMQDAPGELNTGWRGGEPVGLWDLGYNRKYAYAGFAEGLDSLK